MLTALIAGVTVIVAGAAARGPIAVGHRPVAPPRAAVVPRAVPIARVAFAVGVLLSAAVLGPLAIAIGIAIAVERRRRALARRRAHHRRALRQLPEAMERIVLLVHAGLSPILAVRAAAQSTPPPVRAAFEAVVHRLDRGAPLADALTALPDELGPRAAAVGDAFAAADRYGIGLEPVLDQLARDARAERRRLDEAAARRLPIRLAFPLVTCTLPSFVLVAIAPAVIAALSSLGASTW